jgi:hypothetical protein
LKEETPKIETSQLVVNGVTTGTSSDRSGEHHPNSHCGEISENHKPNPLFMQIRLLCVQVKRLTFNEKLEKYIDFSLKKKTSTDVSKFIGNNR